MNEVRNESTVELTISDDLLSGKLNGINMRRQLNLDAVEEQQKQVHLVLESRLATSSYFLGIFTPTVNKYGEEGFWERYHIDAKEHVFDTLKDVIHYASVKGTGL